MMADTTRLPQHVAIIMDGNGRWAKARQRDRIFGHVKGARVAKKIVEACTRLKIKALTLYAFSEENWGRPQDEVNFLMHLLGRYIRRERSGLIKNNIRFQCIGQLEKLPDNIRREVEKSIEMTADNTGMVLTFALSYGGRQEITGAVKKIAEMVKAGTLTPENIDEDLIGDMLQTAGLPDPDLLIRTSGEYRLSNFLPWQSVYTELYFSEKLWPEFKESDFFLALAAFAQRDRRYGKVRSTLDLASPTTALSN